jgi:SGNH hydrolase-like domain, acetyltransferase AlgX
MALKQNTPVIERSFAVLLIVLTVLGALAAAEFALRLLATTSQQIPFRTFDGYEAYEPNTKFEFTNERAQTISIDTDERGLRNPLGTYSGTDTIVLGDSFVSAISTPEPLTFVGDLRARGVAAYNAGVDGAGTFQEFYLLRDHLADSGARAVVLVFFLGNDFRDNYWGNFIEPEKAHGMPEPLSKLEKARGMPGPLSMGLTLSPVRVALRRTCNVSVLCRRLYDQLFLGWLEGMAGDPMGSYALGEMLMLREEDPRAKVAEIKTKAALGEIRDLVAGRGGRLLILGIPSKAQVLRSFKEITAYRRDPRAEEFAIETFRGQFSWDRPDQILDNLCRALAIPYVSLLEPFRSAGQLQLYFNLDTHWRDAGQRLAADLLTSALASTKRTVNK